MNARRKIGIFLEIAVPVFICIGACMADTPKLSDTMIKMKAVKDKILKDYDNGVRPTNEGSNTTVVHTGFMPRQIIEVDEDRGLFCLDSLFFMSWYDPRLVWNATTEYDGYLQLQPETLWRPDITVHNSHSMQVNPTEKVFLLVTSSGHVYWVPPIFTQTSCPSLMETAYPDEVVTCTVILGSWAHDGWEIDFAHGDELYMYYFTNVNPRWELIVSETKAIRNVTVYEGYDEPYISIHAVFPMRRRTPPEIESTRNPCILVMLLTLSIFWLPTNSSKKILLGGILFLALSVMLVYVACATRLPVAAVFAVSFLQSTMYILAATNLVQIFIISNVCNIRGPVRPPPAIMQFLTGSFGKYACLRTSFSKSDIVIDRVQLKEEDSPSHLESPSPKEDWLLFAAFLDRVFFVVMSIAMAAIHHL